LRILYVSHSFPLPDQPLSNVGGMQRVAVELHAALASHPGVDLTTLVLETSWRWTGARTPAFLARLLATIPGIVREKGIDVVLFSSMVTASVTLLLRERIRRAGALTAAIPVGRDVTLPNPFYQRIVPHILGGLDLVFPISRATADTCLARGSAPDRTVVVPCGVDLGRLAPPADRAAARRDLLARLAASGFEVDPDALLLLSVGRHQERKGFHWFAGEVMPGAPPEAVYLVAGSGPTTPRIREAVERSGVGDRVRLLGRVDEEMLTALYRGADLFLMPNIAIPGDIEGFGVVMLEAGTCGMPVLAADLEGIRDVVQDGVSGHLLPSGDVEAFHEAIGRYRDRRILGEAAARASEAVRSRFGWAAVAERYVEILGKTLGERRTPSPDAQGNRSRARLRKPV
jgi:phosphatidyl-myo-inositol dimannoside synthase